MALPRQGRPIPEVIDELSSLRSDDVRWQDGRAFGLVYDGGPGVHEVAEAAALMYLHDNALNPYAIPSLKRIQHDVVSWTAALLHGGDQPVGVDPDRAAAPSATAPNAAGFMTSGGTESIQCAVLAARERARTERGLTRTEIVVASSAHAAFHKAAHMFDMQIHTAAVTADWTADVDAMAELVNDNTALVVGSAMQYPQGVVDPIPAIAELAATVGANCHVDACMGGFVLPFVELLPADRGGREVPPWDFRVEGVHSISADIHKLGYAPKGASIVLYRDADLRRYQTFLFDGWLGGLYGSPNLQGTRAGSPMAAAWAVMQYLGVEGYLQRTEATLAAADAIRAGIEAIEGIGVLGASPFHLIAISAEPSENGRAVDVFAVADAMGRRGWGIDRQSPPDSLHLTVSYGNAPIVDELISDLAAAVAEVGGRVTSDRSTRYGAVE